MNAPSNTTYTIYQIVCDVTNKSYIGMTSNYPTRKSNHLYRLRNGIHIKNGLQTDFTTHGESSFLWFILESHISTKQQALDAETFWIDYFDAIDNGYNELRDLTPTNAIACVWNGIKYDSVEQAAIACNISHSAMLIRFSKGYTCDDDVKNWQRPVTWNGIEYKSLSEAARANGVTHNTMGKRLAKGYTCDSDLKWRRKKGNNNE